MKHGMFAAAVLVLAIACGSGAVAPAASAAVPEPAVAATVSEPAPAAGKTLYLGASPQKGMHDYWVYDDGSGGVRSMLAARGALPFDPEDIGEITVFGESVIDLDGIEIFGRVRSLVISHTKVASLDPLRDLPELERLTVLHSPIETVPDGGLTATLRYLRFDWVPFMDLERLLEYGKLAKVDMRYPRGVEEKALAVSRQLRERGVEALCAPWDGRDQVSREDLLKYWQEP